jgi:hypothetical protein
MINPFEIKTHLEQANQHLENSLEPYQRSALILSLMALLLITTYLLTKKEYPEPRELTDSERKKLEALAEERILKRAEFLRKLRD